MFVDVADPAAVPICLTLLGNRVAPWPLDEYLGRTGFDAQQSETSMAEMDRPNLFLDRWPFATDFPE